jgi:hypothetical protein
MESWEYFKFLPMVALFLHGCYMVIEEWFLPTRFCPRCYEKESRFNLRRGRVCRKCKKKGETLPLITDGDRHDEEQHEIH